MATVRASCGTRFKLGNERMIETLVVNPFYAYRTSVRNAIEVGPSTGVVPYFWRVDFTLHSARGWVGVGTVRNKKFVSIGCMRFVGKERIKLLKWAKSNKKVVK